MQLRKRRRLLPVPSLERCMDQYDDDDDVIVTTTPTTPYNENSHTKQGVDGIVEQNPKDSIKNEDDIRAKKLLNDSTRNEALNELLQLSASHELNYSMSNDSIVRAIVDLCLYDIFEWKYSSNNNNTNTGDDDDHNLNTMKEEDDDERNPLFRSKLAWICAPTNRMNQFIRHCSYVLNQGRIPEQEAAAAQQKHIEESTIINDYTNNTTNKNTSSCFRTIEEKFKTLEVIVVILRNLSFVGANLRLLVYSPELVCVLIACISESCYDSFYNGTNNNNSNTNTTNTERDSNRDNDKKIHYSTCEATQTFSNRTSTIALTSIQTLLNLAKYFDVTGQIVFCDKLFYNDTYVEVVKTATTACPPVPRKHTFGRCLYGTLGFGGMWFAKKLDSKEDTVADITQDILFSLTSDYLIAIWSLFPVLFHVLTNRRTPRPTILASLDLLQELINQARVGLVGDIKDESNFDTTGTNQSAIENKDTTSSSSQTNAGDSSSTKTPTPSNNTNNTYNNNQITALSSSANDMPTLRAILVNMPDTLLNRLIEFVSFIPRLGPDALDYIDPVNTIVTRVTALKLMMGYDATIDTDVRDRSLEILVPLLELDSPRMSIRLGTQDDKVRPIRIIGSNNNNIPNQTSTSNDSNKNTITTTTTTTTNKRRVTRVGLFDALVPILTTTVGRNDASLLASQVLLELSKAIDIDASIRIGFMYIQERLIELASRDQRVSDLVWNHIYRLPAIHRDEDDDEEEDEEGDGNEEEEDVDDEGEENDEDNEENTSMDVDDDNDDD